MPISIAEDIGQISSAPAVDIVPVAKGPGVLENGPCRVLLVGAAGTLNITTFRGVDRDNVPMQQGWNPISVRKVREGGTATDIWAGY